MKLNDDDDIRQENLNRVVVDNDNAGRGLLLGLILAAVAGLAISSIYFLNRRETTPLLVPVPGPTQSDSTKIIDREKTIIEKNNSTKDSTTQPNPAPNVNITVPNPQPQDSPTQPAPSQSAPSQTSPAPAPSQTSPGNN